MAEEWGPAANLVSPGGDECFCGEGSGNLVMPDALVDGSDTPFSCEAPDCDFGFAFTST